MKNKKHETELFPHSFCNLDTAVGRGQASGIGFGNGCYHGGCAEDGLSGGNAHRFLLTLPHRTKDLPIPRSTGDCSPKGESVCREDKA